MYTRLQNGVDRVSRLVRVNESLDITNHRGACQPHRHEHHNKQIQYGCRQPCWRSPPMFGPYLLRPNGCIDQDVTWYGDRPRPRRLCVRWGPAPSPQKGAKSVTFPGFHFWEYRFNSDYRFTWLGTCHTCCPVPLKYSGGINPFLSFGYAPGSFLRGVLENWSSLPPVS